MSKLWQTKGLIKRGIILTALLMFWVSTQAQVMKTMTFEAEDGDIFMLPEVGGIIVESDDGPKLEMVLPVDNRPDEYKTLDIQVGDIIKMFNGKSMKKVSSIQEAYEAMEIGDEVKFGIRRDKGIMMVKFAKMDPKDAPGKMMIRTIDGPGDGENGSIITDLIDAGLVLDEKDGKISVVDVITEMSSVFTGTQPESEDQLIKINSSKINSTEELTQIYSQIKVGEKVELTMLRKEKEILLTFEKPKSEPGSKPFKVMKKQGQ